MPFVFRSNRFGYCVKSCKNINYLTQVSPQKKALDSTFGERKGRRTFDSGVFSTYKYLEIPKINILLKG